MDYKTMDSVYEILSRNNSIKSGMSVCTPEMPGVKMYLTGYVGYYEDFSLDCLANMPDLNALIKVTYTKVKAGEKTYTIMRSVRKAEAEERIEIDAKQSVGILESVKECVEVMQKLETKRISRECACQKLCEVRKTAFKERFSYDNQNIYYHTTSADFVLELWNRKYVCSNFLCLCRYTNPVTGVLSYNLFNPETVIVLSEETE